MPFGFPGILPAVISFTLVAVFLGVTVEYSTPETSARHADTIISACQESPQFNLGQYWFARKFKHLAGRNGNRLNGTGYSLRG